MKEIFDSLHAFLSGLAVPVYPENSVPSDAVFPYVSWTPVQLDWHDQGTMSIRIWDRALDYERLAGLVDRLSDLIGGGRSLPTSSGYIYLAKGTPFAQPQPLQNSEVKVMYINLDIQTLI